MKRFLPYLKYFKPVRWQFRIGILGGLIYALASGAGLPLMTKVIFPLVFNEPEAMDDGSLTYRYVSWMQEKLGGVDQDTLIILSCLWLPLIFVFRAIGGYLNTYFINYCGFRVVESIRDVAFTRLQSLPVGFFYKHQSGDLVARITGDAEMLRQTVTRVSSDIIKQPATLIAALGALIYLGASNEGNLIVLISLLSIPICVFPIRMIGRNVAKKARGLQAAAGDLSGEVTESIQAPIEIRSYNLQPTVLKRFRAQVSDVIRFSMKVVKYRYLVSPAVEFVAVLGISLSLYFGAKNGMTQSDFIAIISALYMAYEPVKKLGNIHGRISQGEASLIRMEEVMFAEGELPEPAQPKVPADFYSEIKVEELGFSYGKEDVFKEINTTIAAGECVALVGESGAGKSTFASLIPRFYDVTSGSIKISGQDVREWKKSELRDRIALVSQNPILFSGTIRENILLGRPGATDAEVEEAAKKAFAHDFILKQDKGYETEVAEKGTKVSGGQRQRIAIARAFLKDAPILILDEATSALDNESEAKIQEALAKLIKNRTTIIIAHRLSTTKIADRVLRFEKGKITQEETASLSELV